MQFKLSGIGKYRVLRLVQCGSNKNILMDSGVSIRVQNYDLLLWIDTAVVQPFLIIYQKYYTYVSHIIFPCQLCYEYVCC